MENTEEKDAMSYGDGERQEELSRDRQDTTPLDRQETAPSERQETHPLPETDPTQAPPIHAWTGAASAQAIASPHIPPQQPPSQHIPSQQTSLPQPNVTAQPYQTGYAYAPTTQTRNYGYPNTSYNYGYPYQTWNSPQPPQAPQEKKWSTSTLILASLIALICGALLGAGIVASANNTFGGLLPDNRSEYGSDPFFPEGTEGDYSSGEVVDSAPGIILINSKLDGALGAGTGMIISADGYAVTNYHVVEGSTAVEVDIADTGETYDATVIGHDAAVDIALLKLNDAKDLDYIEFDTSAPQKGESIFVVGNAGGQGYLSQLEGAITGVDQNITAITDRESSEDLTGLIETDADVVQGYSGGPMYNSAGKVIGVVVAASTAGGDSGDTDGYAIPAKTVKSVIDQIKTGKSKGTTIVGANAALGITVETVDASSSKYRGAKVVQVNHGSAAEKAGIHAGDVISSVNGTTVKSASDLSKLIKTFSIGDTVEVTYRDSGGKEKTVDVTLGESPVN